MLPSEHEMSKQRTFHVAMDKPYRHYYLDKRNIQLIKSSSYKLLKDALV